MPKNPHKLNIILPLLLIGFRLFTLFFPYAVNKVSGIPTTWNNWDAPHFLYLSEHGYTSVGDEANFIVFPPLYPFTIKLFDLVFDNPLASAMFVSNTFFILGSLFFFKFLSEKFNAKIAFLTILFVNIFPTAYFFTSPYTESLFFFLVSLSLYLSLHKHWYLVGAFSGFAFLTRHPGVFLFPSFAYLILTTERKKIVSLLEFLLPFSFCILAYLLVNFIVFKDPFAFQKILSEHWHKNLTFPWVGLIMSWNIAKGGFVDEYSRMIGIAEAVSASMALLLIIPIGKVVKEKFLVVMYATTVIFLCSTNFLLSTPRYLLSIPTLFIFLGILGTKSKIFLFLISLISIILWSYFTLIFTRGQWAF